MMMSVERFERWLRGLDPQLKNSFVIQPRVEGLEQKLADVAIAAQVIATNAAIAATLVLQTALAAATSLAQNAASLADSLAASLALKANIASPTLTGAPQCPIAPPSTSDFQIANTAWVQTELSAVIPPIAQTYHTILEASGSHTAGITPDTFLLGNGNPVVASGTDAVYPAQTISIQSADYPAIAGVTPKLRLRVQLLTNSTDPSCKYFFRLYSIAAVGGGAGGVFVKLDSPIPDSEAFISGPSPDTLNDLVSPDFELPVDGVYVVAVEITHNMQPNSHVVFSAKLQIHNA